MSDDVVQKSNDQTFLLRRLWIHESMRVFSDRLISQADKQLFQEKCLQQSRFYQQNGSDLIFCNFVDFNPVQSVYQEVTDVLEIRHNLDKIVETYNQGKLAS